MESREEWKARMGIGQRSTAFQIVGGPGSTLTRDVPSEIKPGRAGTMTDHWDGRRDAVAMPDRVRLNRGADSR